MHVGAHERGRIRWVGREHAQRLAERNGGLVRHAGELPGTDHPDGRPARGWRGIHGGGSLPASGATPASGTIEQVSVVESALAIIPQPYRDIAIKHRELVKFAFVGGTTWVIDTVVFLLLKSTVLAEKPLTAKIIAVLVATIVSYVLNREWSFRTRGGRERHHEAALFFIVSGVGVVVYSAPLAISRYVFHLAVPEVSLLTQEVADFVSGQIVGVLLGMAFRWWAFRRFVFPDEDVRRRVPAG
jgi:putative flippase GtrA